MCPQRAHILTSLTNITAENTKSKWTEFEKKAFEEMDRLVGKDALLMYSKFSKEFMIHTDASKKQLEAIISQVKRPIIFYSLNLMPAQT